jgi:hypothetical protein
VARRRTVKPIVALIPWVTPLKLPWPCDGIKWGTVTGRDLWPWGPKGINPPRGIQARSRCKKTARWSFKGLGSQRRGTRKLCWDHLMAQGLYGSMAEEARTQRWFAAHAKEIEEIEE